MTDNEIIQALECHISSDANCFDCPADEYGCIDPLIIGAYNLIKRQQAEIERLKGELATDKNDGCKWIPVTERLPEESGVYIVTACDENCAAGEGIWYDTVVIVAEYYKGSWTWNENGAEYDLYGIVTHWMPLPEPPKGE